MKNLGNKLIITGIFVIVLSGFEKILIFLAHQGRGIIDNIALENLTPSIIWKIPNTTYILGILILIFGILLMIVNSRFIKNRIEIINENNKEFSGIDE